MIAKVLYSNRKAPQYFIKNKYQQPIDNQVLRKRKVLLCKSYAFGRQKMTFHSLKGQVLRGKRCAFAIR